MLRLKDFTVQLDFEETLAVSYSTIRPDIQPTVKKGKQTKKKKKKKKKMRRKHKGKGKRHNRMRVRRSANVPSITGGALGEDM